MSASTTTNANASPSKVGASLRIEVYVQDHDAFVDFYTRVLNCAVVKDQRNIVTLPYVAVKRDSVYIAAGKALKPVDKQLRAVPQGVEIVIEVPDLEAEYQRVVATGWPLAEDKAPQPWGLTDFRLFDPDGHYIRITGRYSGTS